MSLVNEAANNSTECHIHRAASQAKHSGKKEAVFLNEVSYP